MHFESKALCVYSEVSKSSQKQLYISKSYIPFGDPISIGCYRGPVLYIAIQF